MKWAYAAIAGVVSMMMGCTTYTVLKPASEAKRVSVAQGFGAASTVEGVRLEARVRAWVWRPRTLERALTPVFLKLENNSDRDLRIRYDDIELVAPRGVEFAALPPFDIRGEVSESAESYAYSAYGFSVAPYLYPYYPRFRRYRGGFFMYPSYEVGYYPVYRRYQLPTNDMLVRALPEGVLEPEGRLAGFVYFAALDSVDDPPERVVLECPLVDMGSGETFGVVRIPFVVERKR